jgi:hypothetical protein
MPNSAQHQAKIQHNQNFLKQFVTQNNVTMFPDWAIVVIFYIAVHYIELYMWTYQKKNLTSHNQRNQALINDNNLFPMYQDYSRLYDLSRDARYNCVQYTDIDVNNAFQRLQVIEQKINGLISKKSKP